MKRRTFLRIAGSGAMGGTVAGRLVNNLANAAGPKTAGIREFFESNDAEILALAQRVFDKCILERLQLPADPLQHTWVRPDGP